MNTINMPSTANQRTRRRAGARGWRTIASLAAVALLTPWASAENTQASRGRDVLGVRVGTVHVGDGRTIENGVVLIEGGNIVGVGGGLAIPRGATVVELAEGSLTPGLIDAFARVESRDAFGQETQGRRRGLAEIIRQIHGEHSTAFACTCTGFAMCPGSHLHASYEDDGVTCPLCAYPKHAPLELLDQASGLVGSGMITELSNEVAAHTSVLDSMNLRSPDLRRLAEGGVTTVFASPDSSAVIGPRGAILRTAGPVQDRVIEPAGAVHAAISSDPYRGSMSNAPPFRGFVTARTRRPNTRMGVTWVFRKAFVDAERHANGLPVGGAETAPYEALDVLWGVRSGEIPLRVHARQKNDIESAIRLTGEFGFGFTLLEATEAFELIDEIRAAGVPVILGPIETDPTGPRRFSPETRRASLATFGALLDAGITTALTAQDLRDENGLARQAMYAVRNGVDPQAALRAVTLTPAEILGVSDRLGSVEVGKQADLVVWSGDPLSPTSRPVVVIVNGRVEVDRR